MIELPALYGGGADTGFRRALSGRLCGAVAQYPGDRRLFEDRRHEGPLQGPLQGASSPGLRNRYIPPSLSSNPGWAARNMPVTCYRSARPPPNLADRPKRGDGAYHPHLRGYEIPFPPKINGEGSTRNATQAT